MNKFDALYRFEEEYGCDIFKPATEEQIATAELKVGILPSELKAFYKVTNGLEFHEFRILPIFDINSPKKTWDSIERANDIKTTKFSLDKALLDKFLIFSELGALDCGMYDRSDSSIWYEEVLNYHRTDLNLIDFIELNLKERN